jgi:hypothetical protein
MLYNTIITAVMQLLYVKVSEEAMSQQQSPTPHQSPNRRSSVILWIGIMLFLVAALLGVYAIVTKQNTVFLVVSFGQAILTTVIGIIQIAPNLLSHLRQTMRTGYIILGISLLIVSLTTNVYLFIRLQTLSNPNAPTSSPSTSTPTSTLTPTQASITSTPTSTSLSMPILVQKNFRSNVNGSNAVTFPSSITAGNLIMVAITHFIGTVLSVTDNHSNTYAQVTAARHANSSSDYVELYYAKNVTGGTTTVTVLFSKRGTVGVYEYSGLDKTSPFDQVTSDARFGSTPDGGTLNTNQDNELYFVVGVDDNGGNSTPSAGSGYTLEVHQDDSTQNERYYTEDRVSAHGSFQTDFSIAVESHWAVIGASFKPAESAVSYKTPIYNSSPICYDLACQGM